MNKSKRLGRPKAPVVLTPVQRRRLQAWSRLERDAPPDVGKRARIILMAAEGAPSIEIAKVLKTSAQTVCKWRRRFLDLGPGGLWTARDESPA